MSMVQAPTVDPQALVANISNKSLSVNQRLKSVGDFMTLQKDTMFSALPKHITPDRLIRVALNSIRKTPKLLDCTPASLFAAIIEASSLGLEPNGILGHAYLVPYKAECTLIPGYKGLMDLCRRSSTVSTFVAEVVRQGDKFAYQLGDDPFVRHVPNDADPKRHEKPITHVYVVVNLRDGGVQRKVWTTAQIDAHKEKYSQGWRWAEKGDKSKGGGKKDSPWHTNWDVMAKKTVIRDMINRGEVPVSVEIQNLAMREEVFEHDRSRVIDSALNGVSLAALDNALTGAGGRDEADQRDEFEGEPPVDAVGYTSEEDSQLSLYDQAIALLEGTANAVACKAVFDQWLPRLTSDGDQADFVAAYDAKLKSFPTESKRKSQQGGLPLNP